MDAGCDFNPRSPYGERLNLGRFSANSSTFQSTLPLRGATWSCTGRCTCHFHFNPRSPYGERLTCRFKEEQHEYFNPRSPYGERQFVQDFIFLDGVFQSTLPLRGATTSLPRRPGFPGFQSTLPLRGATGPPGRRNHPPRISIHAPLTGSDDSLGQGIFVSQDFNPRSPYGERPPPLRVSDFECHFNPRSPYGERLSQWGSILLV